MILLPSSVYTANVPIAHSPLGTRCCLQADSSRKASAQSPAITSRIVSPRFSLYEAGPSFDIAYLCHTLSSSTRIVWRARLSRRKSKKLFLNEMCGAASTMWFGFTMCYYDSVPRQNWLRLDVLLSSLHSAYPNCIVYVLSCVHTFN